MNYQGKFFQFAFFFTLLVIEYLATTTLQIKPLEHSWDKANHFIAFFTLYILLSLAFKQLTTKIKIILLLLYGIQIEIVQSFIPNREFSLLDVVADSIGIIIGILIFQMVTKIFHTK
ncbi:hypothetical protein MNB_SM-3-316 [hydrothermal vent metagenome]|uniref:VanZ-like domain-containing protein n=1 Tax=hydrothermal vent metagenome TaxID=652676 RepID=A0A1W1D5Y8_9ZZZZ